MLRILRDFSRDADRYNPLLYIIQSRDINFKVHYYFYVPLRKNEPLS